MISNQKQIKIQKDLKKGASESKSLANFKERVAAVLSNLNIPLSVYAATENDEYRKPRLGMWKEFVEDYDLDVTGVDLAQSFFVGDAAGRPGDHSQVDRYISTRGKGYSGDILLTDISGFAANVGIDFKTPEQFFLGAPPEAFEKPFDPALYLPSGPNAEKDPPLFTRQSPLELVIFCGSPGAGKSTFYWNHIEPLGYERINQDTLKTVNTLF